MATGGSVNEIETDAEPFTGTLMKICYFEDHKYLLNSQLKKDNFEILIINDEEDYKPVKELQYLLMQKVTYSYGNKKVNPKVELQAELVLEDDSPTKELDFSVSKTLIVFLFITSSFCENYYSLFEGSAILDCALNQTKGNKIFVYVVHTKPKDCRDYELPLKLKAIQNIDFSGNESEDEIFYMKVGKILDSKVHIQIEKDLELFKKRVQFFSEKHPHVLAQYNIGPIDRHSFESQAPVNKQPLAFGRCKSQVNKHPPAIGQSIQNNRLCHNYNNPSIPIYMVPINPNDDIQVDAARGNENLAEFENIDLRVLNISECGSSVGSDPDSADEARCLQRVVQSQPCSVATPEEEGNDIGVDNGIIPRSPGENAANQSEIDSSLDSGYQGDFKNADGDVVLGGGDAPGNEK